MYPRKIYADLKEHLDRKQIIVLTGMRRTGKTTLVKHLLSEIASENKIYIDLQILSNQDIFSARNFDAIIEQFKGKGLDLSKRAYIAIDEIQLVKDIPGILKYLYDNHDIKFIVTGSSSYYMKNLFTESMAGRKKIFELFPLDFGEFLTFKEVKTGMDQDLYDRNIVVSEYASLQSYYEEFVRFGGFPEVVLAKTEKEKIDLLNEIVSSYINIDVSSLADFADRQNAYNVIKMLAARAGNKLDYSKLSRLTGLSRPLIQNYINLFEGTYLISKIPVFTKNSDREIVKAMKLYFCDCGLLGILADIGSGARFENAVYAQLRQKGKIKYFSLKNGREIDFIFNEDLALETKETPTETDLSDLANLAEMAGVKKYRLVGKNLSPKFDDYVWGGSIR
ncbi:MAG: ATP-binding protein [Candidatus Taylorbacteria bacterium]|nr:ATP-binding protein [Candidatus Taylorbacteria bacterium]